MNGYDVIALYIGTEAFLRLVTILARHAATQAAAARKTAEAKETSVASR